MSRKRAVLRNSMKMGADLVRLGREDRATAMRLAAKLARLAAKSHRSKIAVEDCPIDDMSPFQRLRTINPDAYAKVHAAALAFLAIYEQPNESAEVFSARVRRIDPGERGGN